MSETTLRRAALRPSDERREYTRISVNLPARLSTRSGATAAGTLRDISFGGTYFDATDADLNGLTRVTRQHRRLVLSCRLPMGHDWVTVVLRCRLVDVIGLTRVGLQFVDTRWDDFVNLRQFLLTVAPDPEKLTIEIKRYPGWASYRLRLRHWLPPQGL